MSLEACIWIIVLAYALRILVIKTVKTQRDDGSIVTRTYPCDVDFERGQELVSKGYKAVKDHVTEEEDQTTEKASS